jgi:hypothetical protein
VLIRELAAALGWSAAPAFDARLYADRYRAQPKERRRVINALYRVGGTLEMAKLLAQPGVTTEAICALEGAGLIWRVAQEVVLPLEHLFATPLSENEPDKLVESLKIFPKEALWAVATSCKVDVDGADEIVLRARLYRHAMTRTEIKVSGEQMEILRRLEEKGWHDSYQGLEKWRGRSWVSGRCSVEGLLAEASKPLQELALQMLVVPERLKEGSPTFVRLTVPMELRWSMAGSKLKATGCLSAGSEELKRSDGRLRGDLLRYLLMIEQDPPAITQKGEVSLRDLNRLAKRAGMKPESIAYLNEQACDFLLLDIREDRAVIASGAEEMFSGGGGTFAQKIFEARRRLWTRFGRSWAPGAEATAKISDMVMELLQRDHGGVLCTHCLEIELKGQKDFTKMFWSDRERLQLAISAIQGHARLFFLAGLLEVAIDDRDRVKRLQWVPRGIETVREAIQPPRTLVQPTGEIIAPGDLALSDLRVIGVWADVKSVDAVAVFALTRTSALRAAQRGEDPAKFRAFIEKLSGVALPQPVAFHLDELASRMGEVEILPCSALIRVKHPYLFEGLEGIERVSDTLALVPSNQDAQTVMDQMRRQGLLIAKPKVSTTPKDLETLLHQASETDDMVDLVLRGGRTHAVFIESVKNGVLDATDERSGRRLAISLDSIVKAGLSKVDAEL